MGSTVFFFEKFVQKLKNANCNWTALKIEKSKIKLKRYFNGFQNPSGFVFMFINRVWIYKPHKLAFWVAWFGGIGGINFFILGIGKFFPFDSTASFWMVIVPNLVGTFCFLCCHLLSLFMWKLEQFGSSYLPHLNYTKVQKKKRKKNVLYRDLFFLCLYISVGILQIIGISYASLCVYFEDWIKNYVKGLSAAFFILLMGSFLHKEPERAPFSYLLWYFRTARFWNNFHLFFCNELIMLQWEMIWNQYVSKTECSKSKVIYAFRFRNSDI